MKQLGSLDRKDLRNLSLQNAERPAIIGGNPTATSQRQSADRGFTVVQVSRKTDEILQFLVR